MRYYFLLVIFASFVTTASFAGAGNSVRGFIAIENDVGDVRVGRYTTISPVPTREQSDPLSVVIQVSFDPQIATVGESLTHLLIRSGYRLANQTSSDPYLSILLSRPLPQVHRHLGPIRLDAALTTLAGPAWDLVVDPVNRLISYELLDRYRPDSISQIGSEDVE